MTIPCTEERRFQNIEDDIKKLFAAKEKHDSDIASLNQSQTETKIYVKQIFERLDDIKSLFTTGNQSTNATWSKIVIELIKSIATIAAIIAGIKIIN